MCSSGCFTSRKTENISLGLEKGNQNSQRDRRDVGWPDDDSSLGNNKRRKKS